MLKKRNYIYWTNNKDEIIDYKDKDRIGNTLILGVKNSGKTHNILYPLVTEDIINNKQQPIIIISEDEVFCDKLYLLSKKAGRKVSYINPKFDYSDKINLLYGSEEEAINSVNALSLETLINPTNLTEGFFLDINRSAMSKTVKIVKRVKGNCATLEDINNLLNGFKNGLELLNEFSRLGGDAEFVDENMEIYQWFKNDYLSSIAGYRGGTKTYEYCNESRNRIHNLISQNELKNVVNIRQCTDDGIDIGKIIISNEVLIINLRAISDTKTYISILNAIYFNILYVIKNNILTVSTVKKIYIDDIEKTNELLHELINLKSYNNTVTVMATKQIENIKNESLCNFNNIILTNKICTKDIVTFKEIYSDNLDALTQFGDNKYLNIFNNEIEPGKGIVLNINKEVYKLAEKDYEKFIKRKIKIEKEKLYLKKVRKTKNCMENEKIKEEFLSEADAQIFNQIKNLEEQDLVIPNPMSEITDPQSNECIQPILISNNYRIEVKKIEIGEEEDDLI